MPVNYAEKNAARRRCRTANREAYDLGRATRAVLATNGAFGRLKFKEYNDCAVGTTSLPRQPQVGDVIGEPEPKRTRRPRRKGGRRAVQG